MVELADFRLGFKQAQRVMWSVGDYPSIAERLQPVADVLVERVGVGQGQDVLDVATGSGNAALAAARAGGRVTGLDLTPELFVVARGRAEAAGVEIDWIEGDAESLPFADESFDRVLSVFGVMFAPDHRRAAAELVRVCRRGGALGLCAWTPEGLLGQMFALILSRAPPPPPGFEAPARWGIEAHLETVFEGLGVELEITRETVPIAVESAEAWVAYAEDAFGPLVLAKASLEPTGAWPALRAEVVELLESLGAREGERLVVRAEYLLAIARRPEA